MSFFKKAAQTKGYTLPKETLLQINDLHVKIRMDDELLHAVRGVSFAMKKGETLGLVGESGCGKSVTSKEIIGINPSNCFSEGEILFRTHQGDVLNLLELEKDGPLYRSIRGPELSMIFQEPMTAFSPLYTIGNQLSEILRLHDRSLSKNAVKERVIGMLRKVGISNPEKRYDQYPHEFSGGMLQRALIAMMLCCNPQLLIADEPTTALDVTIQAQILELMRSLQQEYGMSILFITHDLGTVAGMCDRVAVMYLGEIVEIGSVRQIFHHAKHPYTLGLLRSVPKVSERGGDKLFVIDGTVPVPIDLPDACGFCDRCPKAMAACRSGIPGMTEVEEGHYVRCRLYEEAQVHI